MKVECPRCSNGNGYIRAFSHVKGGVCFGCGGTGYVERKSAPRKQYWWKCWTEIDGEYGCRFSKKAPSEKQALTKLRKFIERAASKGIGYSLTKYHVELDNSRN